MSRHIVTGAVIAGLLTARIASAQGAPPPENPAKSQVFLYEMALRSAIEIGGQRLAQQALVLVPELTLATTEPAVVRGVRLPGYGFFFDVQAPNIQSTMMVWDMMRRNGQPQDAARPVAERSSPPLPTETPAGGGPVTFDPNRAYTAHVREALIDALLDSSGVLQLAPEERLTVVASGIEHPNSNRLYRAAEVKLILSIRGADLQDLRQGRITRDQAIERITQERF